MTGSGAFFRFYLIFLTYCFYIRQNNATDQISALVVLVLWSVSVLVANRGG